MKKALCILLAVLLLVSLSMSTIAFAEDNDSDSESAMQDQDSAASDEKWSASEIIRMSNFMNGNYYCKTGKWVLRCAVESNGGRLRSTNTLSGESAIIDRNTPSYLIADDLWVTYLSEDAGSNISIKRICVTGGFEQTLIKKSDLPINGQINYLLVHDGQLYFSVNNENTHPITGAFCRADMDGANITTILEKAVYYPYIIDDQLYYQDDGDGYKIHVCNLDGSGDRVFIDDVSYQFISDGISFYYDSYDGKAEFDANGTISNINDLTRVLKQYTPGQGTKTLDCINPYTFAFNGDVILFTNSLDDGRLYSYNIQTGVVEPLYLNDYLFDANFVDPDHIIAKDSNGSYIEGFVLLNVDGTGISTLG